MIVTERKLKQIIVDLLGVDPSEVTANASFVDDLGVDSLDTVELASAFETEFGIDLPGEEAMQLMTVQQALNYIESKRK